MLMCILYKSIVILFFIMKEIIVHIINTLHYRILQYSVSTTV